MESPLLENMDPGAASDAQHGVGKQISYALYGAANRMMRLHKPFLDPFGLTFPQYLVLLELFAKSPRTVGELGGKLGMDAGTITPLLKRLEAAGNITRNRDKADERRVLIDLTQQGKALREPIWTVTDRIKSACGLNDSDLDALRQTLDSFSWPVAPDAPIIV